MKITLPLSSLLFIAILHAPAAIAADVAPADGQAQEPLLSEISALDTKVFAAFNHCAEPGRLDEHAGYFSPDVEFYHDTGGVTWTREAMLANTAKYVCGNFTRELMAGTLKVYPIKDFGAVAQGVHRFCQIASGQCEGMADFVIVWGQRDGKWEITRVLSYGHRATAGAQ